MAKKQNKKAKEAKPAIAEPATDGNLVQRVAQTHRTAKEAMTRFITKSRNQ